MLHRRVRASILELSAKGLSARQIAKVLKISRPSVKKVVESGKETVAGALRPSRLEGRQEEIEELTKRCKGNLVRVHEELTQQGTEVSYQALTAFVLPVADAPVAGIVTDDEASAGRGLHASPRESLLRCQHRLVRIRHAEDADYLHRVLEGAIGMFLEEDL